MDASVLHAADQDAGVDAGHVTDEGQDHDGTDAETAAADRDAESPASPATIAAQILDVVRTSGVFPPHLLGS